MPVTKRQVTHYTAPTKGEATGSDVRAQQIGHVGKGKQMGVGMRGRLPHFKRHRSGILKMKWSNRVTITRDTTSLRQVTRPSLQLK